MPFCCVIISQKFPGKHRNWRQTKRFVSQKKGEQKRQNQIYKEKPIKILHEHLVENQKQNHQTAEASKSRKFKIRSQTL